MKQTLLFFAALSMMAAANPAFAETRCGWFENPPEFPREPPEPPEVPEEPAP